MPTQPAERIAELVASHLCEDWLISSRARRLPNRIIQIPSTRSTSVVVFCWLRSTKLLRHDARAPADPALQVDDCRAAVLKCYMHAETDSNIFLFSHHSSSYHRAARAGNRGTIDVPVSACRWKLVNDSSSALAPAAALTTVDRLMDRKAI